MKLLFRRQIARYALVGIGNTIFGYCCYAALVMFYKHLWPAQYRYFLVDAASITATLIGATVSFLAYKLLVFKTQGNYVREWLRCIMVYGAASLPGLFILPPLTRMLTHWHSLHDISAYLAGAIVMGGTAVCTYIAHTKFSFRTRDRGKTALPFSDTLMATSSDSRV